MVERVTRILCAAEPRGSTDAVERLRDVAADRAVDATVVVGDLGGGPDRRESYRSVFRALVEYRSPVYWVPGAGDAPIGVYLREAYNIEVVSPLLRAVHGTLAFTPGQPVVAGMGGEISDDPHATRDEVERLRYPRWEAEYRLKILAEHAEHERVLIFATPPAHKGRGIPGSEAVAELINTHRPRLVVCGGERRTEILGRSTIVAPGGLTDGHYAVADIHSHEVVLGELAAA
jgi:Icc-related predicted phosphoesterase